MAEAKNKANFGSGNENNWMKKLMASITGEGGQGPGTQGWNSNYDGPLNQDEDKPSWMEGTIKNPDYNPMDPSQGPEFIDNPNYGAAAQNDPQGMEGLLGKIFNLENDPTHSGMGVGGFKALGYDYTGASDYVVGHGVQAEAQTLASQNQAKARMITELLGPMLSEKFRQEREFSTTEKQGVEGRKTEETKGTQARTTQEEAFQQKMEEMFGKEVTDELTGETSRGGGSMQFERDTASQLQDEKSVDTLAQIAAQAAEGRGTMDHHQKILNDQKRTVANNLKNFQGNEPFAEAFGAMMGGQGGMSNTGGGGGQGGQGGLGTMGGGVGDAMGQRTAMNTLAGVNPYTEASANVAGTIGGYANRGGVGAGGQNALSALGAGFQGQTMGGLNAANLYGGDIQTAAGNIGGMLGQQYNNIGQVLRPQAQAYGTGVGNMSQAYGTNLANSTKVGIG